MKTSLELLRTRAHWLSMREYPPLLFLLVYHIVYTAEAPTRDPSEIAVNTEKFAGFEKTMPKT